MRNPIKWLAAAVFFATPTLALADWTVQPESSVGYVSIKNNGFAENNRFSGVAGSLTADGSLEVMIDLTSVETGVQLRNERMQNLLFEVTDFARARISAQFATDVVAALTEGSPVRMTVPLTVSLHGVSKTLQAPLLAVPSGERVLVTSTAPILVSAAAFELESGVAALQEAAGLAAISRAVPVTVDIVLAPAD